MNFEKNFLQKWLNNEVEDNFSKKLLSNEVEENFNELPTIIKGKIMGSVHRKGYIVKPGTLNQSYR